jgi:serine protease AprX
MEKTISQTRIKAWKLIFPLLVLINLVVSGQDSYNYFCRVFFRDKGENLVQNYSAIDLFSEKAIKRRLLNGISGLDYHDIPVSDNYLEQIRTQGFTLQCTSRWLNSAVFKTKTIPDTSSLKSLPFVTGIKIVKRPSVKSDRIIKSEPMTEAVALPPFDRPLTLTNGNIIHSSGYTGSGVLIAVLDAGFKNADIIPSLNHLRLRKGVVATYDFIGRSHYVYDFETHGTAVMSVLAGKADASLEGTAPGANYILLRTEDPSSEYPVEEDYWAAAAEYADSAGADIISSSLGYFNFDDSTCNYGYKDLNGKTAFVTKAADYAASKGILVVNSAGNERNKKWVHIIAPSDGDSVLAAGAVDGSNIISAFSSSGPSADGRIKPDNTAMGVAVVVQTEPSGYERLSGTSFSCPVLSGLAADLLQAVPEATNMEIINAIHNAGDRFNAPDSLYGYGTPDMLKALNLLQDVHLRLQDAGVLLWPNPFSGSFEINFKLAPESLNIDIYSESGRLMLKKSYSLYAGRSIRISELSTAPQGIYLVKITTGKSTFVKKLIKFSGL